MTDDVLPELLKLVCDEFEKSYAANGIVKQVQKKLEDKSATYADAYEYAYEVGCMLSDALTKHVTNELLPNGTMYYNIAQRLLQKTLGTNYELVSELAAGVQKVLNRKAGLTLAALKPDIDQDKVDGLIERLSKGDFENDKSWAVRLLTSRSPLLMTQLLKTLNSTPAQVCSRKSSEDMLATAASGVQIWRERTIIQLNKRSIAVMITVAALLNIFRRTEEACRMHTLRGGETNRKSNVKGFVNQKAIMALEEKTAFRLQPKRRQGHWDIIRFLRRRLLSL